MKKIVSLTMALCSVVSAGAMFASCGHDCEFATDWSKDATHHWHACTAESDCEEVADKAEHTWNAGEVTTHATATTKGVKTYTCTACAQTKTEEFEAVTTVTAEQWAAAFNLSDDICKVSMAMTAETEQGGMTMSMAMSMEYVLTETAIYGKMVESTTVNGETEESSEEAYFAKERDAYYEYEQAEVNSEVLWAKKLSTAEDFADAKSEVDLTEGLPFAFANATYDAATKTYTVADITGNPAEYEPGYKNIKIQFADGKLLSVICVVDQGVMDVNYVVTVSYDNVSVTLPTNLMSASMITGSQFYDAFDLGENWTATMSATHPAGMTMQQVSMRAGNLYKEVQTESDGTETETYENYAEENDSTCYEYVPHYNGETLEYFDKIENLMTYDAYIDDVINDMIPYEFRDFSLYAYDATTGAYVGQEPITVYGMTISTYSFKVNNGQLVEVNYSITMQGMEIPYTITFTYGNASVTLPANVQNGNGVVQG